MDRHAELDEVLRRLSEAARLDPAGVPARVWGDAWFRRNEPYLTVTAVAGVVHRELRSGQLQVGLDVLREADRLLGELETDSARELVEVGLVEGVACLASHDGDGVVSRNFLDVAPPELGRIWRRRTARLQALGEDGLATGTRSPRGWGSEDPGRRLLAHATSYRIDENHWLDLEEIVSADDPSPWLLRHPVLTGLIFLAVLTTLFLISVATGAGPFIRP